MPGQLVGRWSRRGEVIERAAREFRDRYGRAPHAGELGAIAVATRGTKTITAEVDVSAAWRAVGEEYGLTPRQGGGVVQGPCPRAAARRSQRTAHGCDARAVDDPDARARGAGRSSYRPACSVPGMRASSSRRSSSRASSWQLDGGWWTTRELRELEQQALDTARERSHERVGVASAAAREAAEAAGSVTGTRSARSSASARNDHRARVVWSCWSVRPGPARASCSTRHGRRGSATGSA